MSTDNELSVDLMVDKLMEQINLDECEMIIRLVEDRKLRKQLLARLQWRMHRAVTVDQLLEDIHSL